VGLLPDSENSRADSPPSGRGRRAVSIIAGAWSLFQLSLPQLITLNSDYVRAIHLVFAIVLVYLSFPALKKIKLGGPLKFLSAGDRLCLPDVILAFAAALAAGYYALNYAGISVRQGMSVPPRDIAMGVLLVVLLLEAARRALGPALSCVAGLFIAYGFLGPYMPELFAFGGLSLKRMLSQLTLSSEGIYGVPLRVSASTVFLFVLLGAMLEKSGGGQYFVQLAFSLLGRFKGGPAKAAVVASGLTGMVSGSSIANVVTTGTFTIPLMKRCGYPAEKACAIEVAASTNGQLMPPIMGAAAFIIAEYCNLSYLQVVRAAIVPAVISYLALIYITHLEACKLGLRGLAVAELPRFGAVFVRGVHFLIPLGLLVGMLLTGFSPQLAAFYAILALAGLIVVKELINGRHSRKQALANALRLIWQSLVSGGKGMMAVGVACAAAGIIVGIVGMGLGEQITQIVDTLAGGNIMLILLLTAFASLVLGMGLPTTATYIVMASLTAGVIVELAGEAGFEVPLIAAHLFCFFFGILADDTPPVGLAAYAAAAIGKANPIKTGLQGFAYDLRTAILPFVFIFNTDLLLWNIHAWWHIAIIFATGTIALFAFAALVHNYTMIRNRIHESILLVLCVLLLLRPQAVPGIFLRVGQVVPESKFVWYALGSALFGLVYLLQWRRARATAELAADA
jgi:TRAP transporter 4TM/12TM fusion protein